LVVLRKVASSARVLRLVPRGEQASTARAGSIALDDAEILGAVRRGDRSAAAALHARIRPQIELTLHRLLGRRDPDQDDLAQLSLIALVGSLDRFRGDCSLDTWTARITAHTVFKELRRRRSARALLESAEERLDVEPSVGLEREACLRSLLRRVRHHLDAMDPLRAWTVVLHDVSGHDLREIADIMECSVAAAQSRLVRGRADLHERIAADPELAGALERDEDGR
jgi:RNA polymerase sigma-70 factor (ECF subfamily)